MQSVFDVFDDGLLAVLAHVYGHDRVKDAV
jgi:hypothetical protein